MSRVGIRIVCTRLAAAVYFAGEPWDTDENGNTYQQMTLRPERGETVVHATGRQATVARAELDARGYEEYAEIVTQTQSPDGTWAYHTRVHGPVDPVVPAVADWLAGNRDQVMPGKEDE